MKSQEQTDEILIQAYLSGASENFETLVRRYEEKVFTTALYLTSSTRDAEHVLRKVFIALYHKLQTDPGKTPLFSWLIQHTLDAAINKLVTNEGERFHSEWPMLLDDTLEDHLHSFYENNSSVRYGLGTAVCMLPYDLKLVFLLRDIQGLTIQETARILELNVFEARNRLRKARMTIREELPKLLAEAELGGNDPQPSDGTLEPLHL